MDYAIAQWIDWVNTESQHLEGMERRVVQLNEFNKHRSKRCDVERP